MPSTISAGTSAGTALNITSDTTGNLAFQTNNGVTALTIDTSQNVTFANNVTYTGNIQGATITATAAFSGNGATISAINASNVTSGTLASARLPTSGVNASTITAGTLAVAQGGTGASTLTANNVLLGNGTSALQAVAPSTNGNVLTSNGTTWVSSAPSGGGQLQFSLALRGSAVNSSGSPMVFNSTGSCTWTCPAGVTKIKLVVVGGGGGGAGDYGGGTLGGYGGFGIGFYTVTPGTAYAVTIGAGASGAGGGGTGGTGGSSSFGSLLTATGGTGGVREYGQRTNGSASLGNIKNSNAGSAFCDATSGPQYISDGNAGSAQTYTISSQYSAGSAGQSGQVVNQGQGSMSGAVYVEYVGS